VIVTAAFAGLAVAGICALARLLVGPTLADRIIALDLALISLMSGIAIDAADRGDTTWLNLLVVIAIVGFTATVAITRFIERDAERRSVR
jgi:multisubunit Na+/H+ antiporter MnhF subunit